MNKSNEVKIGMIGLGYWGKNILRNLYELKVLHIACDSNPKIIKERKAQFSDINYTLHFEDMLNDSEIKAVVISTPAATHYELIKETLNADKDVFVEKPLSLNFKHGKELVGLAKDKSKILMVGHILQYHPAIIKLKELIEKGELGKVQYIYSNRLNIGKLRVEENILWSFAPHDISVILMLVGDEPLKISCFGGDYLNNEIYDVTLTSLKFKNKVKAHVFVSWLHPFKEQKLIVVGSKAMAVFDDLTKEKLFIYPHRIEWKNGKIPVVQKADHYCVEVENKEPLREELRHFIECINKREQPRTNGEEGLRVLRILEEAEKSLQNSTVIAGRTSDEACLPAGRQSQQNKKFFVHESSFIDEDVQIGEGTKIWHFSHILKGSRIGRGSIIGQNVTVGPEVIIGNRCKIQNNVSVYKGVTLEDEVFIGPSAVFTNVYTPRAFIERKNEFLPTIIKRGATIGANATIVCGATVGKYAFIGAGAVVKKDVPDYALVVGIPAKQIGWVCRCGVTLKFDKNNYAQCGYCNSKYRLKDGLIEPMPIVKGI